MRTPALVCCLLLLAGSGPAVAGDPFNQRDDEYVLLGLKRAQESFELAKSEFARLQELFDHGLLSAEQLDQSRRSLSEAEVNYQQSLLAALFEDQYIAIRGAVKQRREGGRKSVRLTIENTAGGGAELKHLAGLDDELFAALAPDRIHDVYVSLLNDDGAIISQPYEAKLEELLYRRPVSVDFALLQDLDAVTVAISYGNGGQRQVKVFLQRDSSEDRLALQPLQFSQEASLGDEASFDLGLELFSGSDDSYQLAVLGLPAEIHRTFSDPASGARLRQVRFTEAAEARQARLTLTLPDRSQPGLPLDQPIEFFVVAAPAGRLAELESLAGRAPTTQELAASGLGWARLELVVRGLGELRVVVPQLLHHLQAGAAASVVVDLRNEGSAALRNLQVEVDVPLGWSREIEPALIPQLGVGEEARLVITLRPAEGTSPGRYEARLRTGALSDSQPVSGEDKLVTIELEAATNLFGTAALLLVILAVVLGLIVFGIRLTRQ